MISHKLLKINLLTISLIVLLSNCGNLPGVKPGNLAPDFKIKDINNQSQSLAQYKGKVVLLHFWTDFCQSCRAEFPRMQEFYSELKGKDFEMLAINVGQSPETSRIFQKDFQVSFPMLPDKQKITKDLYHVEAFPTNYFVNPEGKIIRKIVGWLDKTQIEVIINQNKAKKGKVAVKY